MSFKYSQALLVLLGIVNYSGVKAVQTGSVVQQKLESEMASAQKIQIESKQKLDQMALANSAQTMAQKMQTGSQTTVKSKQKLASTNKMQIEEQNTNQLESEAKWGFLKNIVNIDTFFSSGSSSSTESKDEKKKSSPPPTEPKDKKKKSNPPPAKSKNEKKKSSAPPAESKDEKEKSSAPPAESKDEENKSSTPSDDSKDDEKKGNSPSADSKDEEKKSSSPSADTKDEEKKSSPPPAETKDEEKKSSSPSAETKDEEKKSSSPPADTKDEKKKSNSPPADTKDKEKKSSSPSADSKDEDKKSSKPSTDSKSDENPSSKQQAGSTKKKQAPSKSKSRKNPFMDRVRQYKKKSSSFDARVNKQEDKSVQKPVQDFNKKEINHKVNRHSRTQQDQIKKDKKLGDKIKNQTVNKKVAKNEKLNATKIQMFNVTKVQPVQQATQKVVRKWPVFQLNQMDSQSQNDQQENNKNSSIAQTSSDSGRSNAKSDQDVSPDNLEAQKSMQATNSEQSVTEWMRPGSVDENPRDNEGKPLEGEENVVQKAEDQEKEDAHDKFVKKEFDDADISDEDHPPIKIRESNPKSQIKGKKDEDHPQVVVRDSKPNKKMKNYFRQPKKSKKQQQVANNAEHQSAEKLEKALEKLNKRSAQVEDALKKFGDASSLADKLKQENTLESVDAHKKLYETKRRAVKAVEAKKRAQSKLNKVLKNTEDHKSSRSSSTNDKELTPIKEVSDSDDSDIAKRVPAQKHLADQNHRQMSKSQIRGKQPQELQQSKSTENEKVDQKSDNTDDQQENSDEDQPKKDSYSLFTLTKHDGRLTLRHMKFEAANQQEIDETLSKHQDRSMITVKDNQIVNSNCYEDSADKSVDYQRLVGFATIEGTLHPEKLQRFNMQSDQRYLTWVEGQANLKDIVWKSIHGLNSQKKVNQLFQKHQEHGNGPVMIKISDKDQSLHIMKHNNGQHMPKQALGLGHFITQKLKLYDAPTTQSSSD